MIKRYLSKNTTYWGLRAQAIVEFAIVLPILLVILVGILEFGRMIFIYSSVTNASRDAVRYASAVGLGDNGYHKFNNCVEIKNRAVSSSYLLRPADVTVSISYDHGPGSGSAYAVCDATSGEDADVVVTTGDRVLVTVAAQYRPMVKLIPIGARTFTSSSYRTILGVVKLDP